MEKGKTVFRCRLAIGLRRSAFDVLSQVWKTGSHNRLLPKSLYQ